MTEDSHSADGVALLAYGQDHADWDARLCDVPSSHATTDYGLHRATERMAERGGARTRYTADDLVGDLTVTYHADGAVTGYYSQPLAAVIDTTRLEKGLREAIGDAQGAIATGEARWMPGDVHIAPARDAGARAFQLSVPDASTDALDAALDQAYAAARAVEREHCATVATALADDYADTFSRDR